MPNKKAAIKSVRQDAKRRLHNRAIRSKLSRTLRLAEEAIAGGSSEQTEQLVKEAVSVIARTNSKGIIHRNKAARQTARLMKKYNKLNAPNPENSSTS